MKTLTLTFNDEFTECDIELPEDDYIEAVDRGQELLKDFKKTIRKIHREEVMSKYNVTIKL